MLLYYTRKEKSRKNFAAGKEKTEKFLTPFWL